MLVCGRGDLLFRCEDGQVSCSSKRQDDVLYSAKCTMKDPKTMSISPNGQLLAISSPHQLQIYSSLTVGILKKSNLADIKPSSDHRFVWSGWHPMADTCLVTLSDKGLLSLYSLSSSGDSIQAEAHMKVNNPIDYSMRFTSASFCSTPTGERLFDQFTMTLQLETNEVLILNPVIVPGPTLKQLRPEILDAQAKALHDYLKDIAENPTEFGEHDYEEAVEAINLLRDGYAKAKPSVSVQGPLAVVPEPVEDALLNKPIVILTVRVDGFLFIITGCSDDRKGRVDIYVLLDTVYPRFRKPGPGPILYLLDSCVFPFALNGISLVDGLESEVLIELSSGTVYYVSLLAICNELSNTMNIDSVKYAKLDIKGPGVYGTVNHDDSYGSFSVSNGISAITVSLPFTFRPLLFKHSMPDAKIIKEQLPTFDMKPMEDQLAIFKASMKRLESAKEQIKSGKLSVNDLVLIHEQVKQLTGTMETCLLKNMDALADRASYLHSLNSKHLDVVSRMHHGSQFDLREFEQRTADLKWRVDALLTRHGKTDVIDELADKIERLKHESPTVEDPLRVQHLLIESIRAKLQ